MRKLYFFIFAFFLFLIAISYQKLPFTFYQQDEWWAVGHILTEPLEGFTSHFSLPRLIAGGGRPLSIPLQYFLYTFSLFDTRQFAIFAIMFHLFNTVLLFLIINKLTKNTLFSFTASVFFATASIASQAVTWIGTSTATLPSTFFVLLSIYLYTFFLKSEKKKFLYWSLVFAIVSYFFKESAIFLFFLLPIMYVLYSKKLVSFIKLVKLHSALILYACFAIGFVLFELFFVSRGQTTSNIVGNADPIVRLLAHGIFYPFESLSQIFIFPNTLFSFAKYFGELLYSRVWFTSVAPIATETIGAEMLSVIASSLILVLFYIMYKIQMNNRRILLFGLLLIFLSFLPYIPLEKGSAYLESRYYYIAAGGGGILLAGFFEFLRFLLMRFMKLPQRLAEVILFIPLLFFIYANIIYIQQDIETQVSIAKERKEFLAALQNLHPAPKNNTVFYIIGNTDYYISDHKVPFQQGMGYTLMVWYYKTGIVPKELLQQSFLWGISEQGYKEINGKGLGYFWDRDELKKEMMVKNLDKNNIVGFYYDGKNKIFKDITDETRKKLSSNE